MYVGDVVEVLVGFFNEFKVVGEVVNIGNDYEILIFDLVKIVK